MAIVRGKLAEITTIPATTGVIYANPASTKTYIGGITLHNTHTSTEFVEIYVVPDSGGSVGTAALANRIIAVALAPNETINYPFPGDGISLTDTNDSLQADTNTASKVTILLSGPKEV